MKFQDDSNWWTYRILAALLILATIAFKIALAMDDCENICTQEGGKYDHMEFESFMTITCICSKR
jgi:hypothetical protein